MKETTQLTETERAELNARLARAMGWKFNDLHGLWIKPGAAPGFIHQTQREIPDFTRDLTASRELVVWLAAQDEYTSGDFLNALAKMVIPDRWSVISCGAPSGYSLATADR